MHYPPVHWSDGMFLRPHHFQAADRHWNEQFALSSLCDTGYNYGFRALDLNVDAIANYQVAVNSCTARMKDGTVVAFDVGQGPGRLELKEALENHAQLTVFLAVPRLVLGRANVGQEGAAGQKRFVESELSIQDESQGGGDRQIGFRRLNARLALSVEEELSGYELLPIARIKRVGAVEAQPVIDDDFFPPVLSIDAWPPLCIDLVRNIYDYIGQKIEVLSRRLKDRGVSLTSQDPQDLEAFQMLAVLNEIYTKLRCLAFAQGVHPFVAYSELCQAVGRLSIFDEARRAPEVPLYDHDDLARIFKWIKIEIERLLKEGGDREYVQRPFIGTEGGMQVAIESTWLHAGWEWYVGVYGENATERECRELLQPGKLNWKLGSSQQVDQIFKFGLPGVEMRELPQAPTPLPTRGWIYYEVIRKNNAWNDVLATQAMALRFTKELIGNLESLPGEQKLEVITPSRRSVLRFSLFAVPKTTAPRAS